MRHDPTFWIIARSAGLTAYVLLTASMLAGLTLKTRVLGRVVKPSAITDVHRALALAGLGALVLHGIALVLDATVRVTLFALLIPGLVDYRTWWVGAGVIAGELMALVTASFWARKRIGVRVWRSLHWLSYAAFLLASAHGLMAGSDTGRPWTLTIYASALGSVTLATGWRALGRPTKAAVARAAERRRASTVPDRA